jgi:hypothetical protein
MGVWGGRLVGKPCLWEANVSEHLNLQRYGKAASIGHDRQPDSGKPTVRDDMGGLRKRGYRKILRAPYFYPDPLSPCPRCRKSRGTG